MEPTFIRGSWEASWPIPKACGPGWDGAFRHRTPGAGSWGLKPMWRDREPTVAGQPGGWVPRPRSPGTGRVRVDPSGGGQWAGSALTQSEGSRRSGARSSRPTGKQRQTPSSGHFLAQEVPGFQDRGCTWVNSTPPPKKKSCPSGTLQCALFGNRVFVGAISEVQMRSHWSWGPWVPDMWLRTGILVRLL